MAAQSLGSVNVFVHAPKDVGSDRDAVLLLPGRYHVGIVQKHLEATERHRHGSRPCRRQPWARHMELAHGAHRFELECWQHSTTWTKDVTVPDTLAFVRDVVDYFANAPCGICPSWTSSGSADSSAHEPTAARPPAFELPGTGRCACYPRPTIVVSGGCGRSR